MMLQPVVNKITVRIRKSGSGPAEFWLAETPRAFSDAAVLSAMHPLLIDPDLVEKSTVVSDAARDNVGSARQDHPDTRSMTGTNSPNPRNVYHGECLIRLLGEVGEGTGP